MIATDCLPKGGFGRKRNRRPKPDNGQNGIEMSAQGRFGGSLHIADFPEEQSEISVVTDTYFAEDSHKLPEVPLTPSVSPLGKGSCCDEEVKAGRRRKLWWILMYILMFLCGILISLLIFSAVRDQYDGICLSQECVSTAERVLHAMDPNINPCEDFYGYACGGWHAKNPIPETSSTWDQFVVLRVKMSQEIKSILEKEETPDDPEPVKLAKKLYDMCITQDNKENHTELLTLIENVVGNGPFQPPEDMGTVLGRIQRELNGNFILSMYIFFDEKSPLKKTIYIDQQTFGVPMPILLDTNKNLNVEAYENLIADVWPYVYPDVENASLVASQILEFEREIGKIATPMEKRRNRDILYNPMSLEELVEILPQAGDWKRYFKEIFLDSGLSVDWNNLTVIVKDVPYFKALDAVLSRFDHQIIRNYLKWRIIYKFGNALSTKFQQKLFEYVKLTLGVQYPPPRYKVCSDWVNHNLGWAVSYGYIQSNFKSYHKAEVDSIVNDIRDGFYEILRESDWIAQETKSKAYRKAERMRAFIAYPEWLLHNKTALQDEYVGLLNENFNQSHFDNFVKVFKWDATRKLKELEKDKDYNRWLSYSTVVNAFYSSSYNAIAFPAGILRFPFFGFPLQSMNYGGIGAVIGHEITHAFDDEGRQSDETGLLKNWWDDSTLAKYKEKTHCFIQQYGNYSIPELNMTLNGINTLGENIADNGGLRQAFRGYKAYVKRHGEEPRLPGMELTSEQLFFVAFAQSLCGEYRLKNLQQFILTSRHSPWQFQVKGTIANSRDFARTWNCNSPPNPCEIW